MDKIYITGHRNPDLDSVCSAAAYAVLKNTTDPDNSYIPVRPGHLSESAKRILSSLDITPPPYKRDIYPKVSDVMLTHSAKVDVSGSLNDLADSYNIHNPSATPVFDGDTFAGLITVDDIASWMLLHLSEEDTISRIPSIRELMRDQAEPFSTDDLFEDAKSVFYSSSKRGIAVFDDDGYAGYVTRRCFLNTPRHKVILVDHNEPGQSIRGIETASVVEIIDHHRLDAVRTDLPIFIDAEPLGSTCTIVYQLFRRSGVEPDPQTAKILLTGIIADTLILKSPTTTDTDVRAAAALSTICRVDTEQFGLSMFSNTEGLKTRDPLTAVTSDFKTYNEKGVKVGIGQCEVTTLNDLSEYSSAYLDALEEVRVRNGLDWAVLMITNVLNEHSVLLCTDYKANKKLSYSHINALIFDMPGVLSRKKQLLPEILFAIGS
ncbi:MAG: DHH family phosphoesterase [Oscillospiraceae bacterium]|nr:DHH family phosphoesterase [Oscillospiraceae bacterium]